MAQAKNANPLKLLRRLVLHRSRCYLSQTAASDSVEWRAPQQPEGIHFVIIRRRPTIFARRFWTSPHYAVVGFSMDEKADKAENRTHHRDRLEADRADDPSECF